MNLTCRTSLQLKMASLLLKAFALNYLDARKRSYKSNGSSNETDIKK